MMLAALAPTAEVVITPPPAIFRATLFAIATVDVPAALKRRLLIVRPGAARVPEYTELALL